MYEGKRQGKKDVDVTTKDKASSGSSDGSSLTGCYGGEAVVR
jgi:hypothetical protein